LNALIYIAHAGSAQQQSLDSRSLLQEPFLIFRETLLLLPNVNGPSRLTLLMAVLKLVLGCACIFTLLFRLLFSQATSQIARVAAKLAAVCAKQERHVAISSPVRTLTLPAGQAGQKKHKWRSVKVGPGKSKELY
jgi:hypothetical protein